MLSQSKAQTAAAGPSSRLNVGAVAARSGKRDASHRKVWRPTIDIEQVRASWNRADQFFAAVATHDVATIRNLYAETAELHNPIIGAVSGPLIGKALSTFLIKTPDLAVGYQIIHAGTSTAEVEWTAAHCFADNNRPILIQGTTLLQFAEGRIKLQRDSFNCRDWFRQALGIKGLLVSFIPGWRKIIEVEMRRSLAIKCPSIDEFTA